MRERIKTNQPPLKFKGFEYYKQNKIKYKSCHHSLERLYNLPNSNMKNTANSQKKKKMIMAIKLLK